MTRWAVPLLKEGHRVRAVDHRRCDADADDPWGACVHCLAERHLRPEDWAIVRFYGSVSDLVVNQAPMGTKSGEPVTTPRLSEWVLAAEMAGYPRARIPTLIDGARALHDALEGRAGATLAEVHTIPARDLEPPVLDEAGG